VVVVVVVVVACWRGQRALRGRIVARSGQGEA